MNKYSITLISIRSPSYHSSSIYSHFCSIKETNVEEKKRNSKSIIASKLQIS